MNAKQLTVADNKTYKDQYHFNDKWFRVKGEDLPSVNDEDKINSTIKENKDRSNVEIEGGEIVLQPDLTALFKALGKKHKGGGMDVMLKPDSFVFSDDKSLSFNEDDHELFEFKKGGNFKDKNNTPAIVLKRNIDVKHYNTLINNLDDPYKDDLAKKSSAMMLEKYIGTLGGLAYVQEQKKGFPDGLPKFSMGAEPVYDQDLRNNIDSNKQYAKYGGPILPKAQYGLTAYKGDRNFKGNKSKYTDQQWNDFAKKLDFKGKGNKQFQEFLFNLNGDTSGDQILPNVQDTIIGLHKKYGNPLPKGEWFDNRLGHRWDTIMDQYNQNRNQPEPEDPYYGPSADDYTPSANPITPAAPVVDKGPEANQVFGPDQYGKSANWQFTPWQRTRQAWGAANAINTKRYLPTRSHLNGTYFDPVLLNEQQAVGNAQGMYKQQLDSLRSVNPILANSQRNSSFGKLISEIPNIGLSVENQNVGIRNQYGDKNVDRRNTIEGINMANDKEYIRDSILGRSHFDNLREHKWNNYANQVFQDAEDNQSLAYKELTLNNPAYKFDFRTGQLVRNMDKNILDTQGRAPQDSWNSMVEEVNKLKRSGLSDQVISALVRGRFFQQAAPYFQQAQNPPPFGGGFMKKGGRYRSK